MRTSLMTWWRTAVALLILSCSLSAGAATPTGDWLLLPERVWTADGDHYHRLSVDETKRCARA